MSQYGGRLFGGKLFAGKLFARVRRVVRGPSDTDRYRRIANDAVALRVAGDANPVMIAIGRRRMR